MRRFMILVTVVVLMTATLIASAAPALAAARQVGTPLPTVVCETPVASPLIGWKDEQCWVFHAASTGFF